MSDSIEVNKQTFEDALKKLDLKKELMVGIIDQDILSLIEDVVDEYTMHYRPDIEYTMEEVGKINTEYVMTMRRLISSKALVSELQAKISSMS